MSEKRAYQIDGKIYYATSPDDAYAQADADAAAEIPPEQPESGEARPISTRLVKGSAGFLNAGLNRSKALSRRAVNLALPKSAEPEWATNEAIKKYDESIKPQTFPEKAGEFAADWALGTAVGAGPEKALAAIGLRALPRAGALLRGAGRVAAGTAAGAAQGALEASPDDRSTGAMVGGVLGGAADLVATVGRPILRVLGKNRVSKDAARVLKEIRKVDPSATMPASHSTEPGIVKSLYEGVVANSPSAGGAFRDEHQRIVNAGYRRLIDEITPVNTPLDTVIPKGGTVHDAMANLNPAPGSGGAWDRALGKYNDEVFDTSRFQIPKEVEQTLNELRVPSTISDEMTGKQLITLRDDIQRARNNIVARKAGGDEKLGRGLVKAYDDAREEILEIMKRKYLDANRQPLPGMADYLEDLSRYKEYDTFFNAVSQTSTGEPGFGAIAMAAQRKSPQLGVMGQAGPLQTMGNDMATVLGDFPSKQGIFQMGASQGMSAKAVGAALPGQGSGHLLPQALAFMSGPALAHPKVQKFAAEGSVTARNIEQFFSKYPEFGKFVRSGAIALTRPEDR